MRRMLTLAFTGLAGLALVLPASAHAGTEAPVAHTYAWHSDRLVLQIPADVEFHPGPRWHLTISAPPGTLKHIRVNGDRITAEPHGCFSLVPLCIGFGAHLAGTVHVNLTGPALRVLKIEGAGKIHLNGLRQKQLVVNIDGSASVYGSGSLDDLRVEIDGAGDIHLKRLSERHARVVINGSGTVGIAPTDSVTADIRGAGTVRLHSSPPHVSSRVDGVGEVVRVPAG